MSFNLDEFKGRCVHLIGIGGSMMSGIAGILVNNGVKVTGSDFKESKGLDTVRKMGIKVTCGHLESNISDQDLIVYTAAIKDDNPEIIRAKELKIPLMTRSQFLGHLMDNFENSIGIAGTHGKTSTSSMLTSITMKAGLDPTVLVGAHVPSINSNYRVGKSEVMVVESCEYTKSFLDFPPKIAVILNVEEDHVDCYKDLEEVKEAFKSYINLVKTNGFVVANADDKNLEDILKDTDKKLVTFGINKGDFRAKNITVNEDGFYNFDFYEGDNFIFNINMPVAGLFNIYNIMGASIAAMLIGAHKDKIKEGILSYKGVDRRLQELGTINGVRFIDDYGHHPTEVKNALETVKNYKHKKLFVVEQPHTFTRLHRFFDDFTNSFDTADELILLPVFAAREKDTNLTSSKKLGEAIRKKGNPPTTNVDSYEEGAMYIMEKAKEGDIVLLIGAGEGYKIFDIIKAKETSKN